MQKKLTLTFALFIIFNLAGYASHLTGGQISYTYIGDSTGIPHHYEITLKLLRRDAPGSATIGSFADVIISSSCYSQQTITLNRVTPSSVLLNGDGGYDPRGITNCSGVAGGVDISAHQYKGTVTLPGACSDFVFAHRFCCRNNTITNLQTPSSYYFYCEATLNNVVGDNSSPDFEEIFPTVYCLGKISFSINTATETDGDSVVYSFDNSLDNENVAIPYTSGLSVDTPIASSSPISLDPATGTFSFTASNIQVPQIKIKATEYRKNSSSNQYEKIGTASKEFQFSIVGQCDTSTVSWGLYKDTLGYGLDFNNIKCGGTVLEFWTPGVFVSTIAKDGSDFLLTDSLSNPIQIKSATGTTTRGSALLARKVRLILATPINYDDSYILISKKGTDSNTLFSICGYIMGENDTTLFKVSDCNTRLSLSSSQSADFDIYPSPAKDFITVSLPFTEKFSGQRVSIYNLQGQKMKELIIDGSENQKIHIENFPSGVYTLVISDKNQSLQTKKFVVE